MAIDTHLRSVKDRLLAPIVAIFCRFHPVTITIMSLVAGLISCVCLALGCGTTAALIFWLLNRIL